MKWIVAKVTVEAEDPGLAIDLIADIFYSLGLKGVVVDDPQKDSRLDWDDDAVQPPDAPGVTGYVADTRKAADLCRALETGLRRLASTTGISARTTYSRIDEEDWANAWKEYFWPEKISASIVVKPTWRDYNVTAGEIVLEIDPGMAFGTGTHPTTALCIRLIEAHLKPDASFLDVGTGSGILMIAAAKLGAGTLCGVDHDATAVGVARENLRLNGIDRFRLFTGNLVDDVSAAFDIVAANILAEVILDLLPAVRSVLNREGLLICSGIITAKKELVSTGLRHHGFEIVESLEEEGWVAIAARRTEGGATGCRPRGEHDSRASSF